MGLRHVSDDPEIVLVPSIVNSSISLTVVGAGVLVSQAVEKVLFPPGA